MRAGLSIRHKQMATMTTIKCPLKRPANMPIETYRKLRKEAKAEQKRRTKGVQVWKSKMSGNQVQEIATARFKEGTPNYTGPRADYLISIYAASGTYRKTGIFNPA